jgi:CRISPR type III-B/RAMP module RAMP protein Cmr1
MRWHCDIEILTPLFCRGAYQDAPELRVPSIRGMVRWWFRTLGGSPDEEKTVFGGLNRFGQRTRDETIASRVVFRVSGATVRRANPNPFTLPHKPPSREHAINGTERDPRSPRAAFAPNGRFTLEVFSRFGGVSDVLADKTIRALEVWLLLGSLGLRANRTGGSIWPVSDAVPQSPAHLAARLKALGCSWPVYLASSDLGSTLDSLRSAATDTIEGYPAIFGQVRGGRIASRIKFKIVRLDGTLRLLITAPDEATVKEARRLLASARKRLADVAWEALPA